MLPRGTQLICKFPELDRYYDLRIVVLCTRSTLLYADAAQHIRTAGGGLDSL